MNSSRRILIVDDSASIHEDFRRILCPVRVARNLEEESLEQKLFPGELFKPKGPLSFDVDFAFQGVEAVEKARQAIEERNPYSVAFVDVRIPPGIDGITTIERIWEVAPDTEIVICTAFSDYPLERIQERLGRSERVLILKKPFEPVEIQQMALALSRKWFIAQELTRQINQVEEILRSRTEQLEQQLEINIQNARMVAIGRMAGRMAHEINTPLGVITVATGRLVKKVETRPDSCSDCAAGLRQIEKTTFRIAKIIDDLLKLSKELPSDTDLDRILSDSPVRTIPEKSESR